jgi:8-oxo-dGTP pyrophosphatase MutT (NUDIX family)
MFPQQWQLPKGRKNVHEDFAAAALRETTEETGVAVQPLYLRFSTRLTLPDEEDIAAKRLKEAPRRSIDNGIVNILSRDIFYISQYPDPATGAMRHMYWYAAKPRGSTTPDIRLMGRDDIRRMKVQWFSAAEAVGKLKMRVEQDAVALAVHYAEQMSEEEWNYSREL